MERPKALRFKVFQTIKIVFLALILSFSFSYVFAQWVGPTGSPPSGNTPAPINVGTSDQTKTGGLLTIFDLWIDSSLGVTGGAVFGGNVGIGTTSPSVRLEANGEVRASTLRTTGDLCIDNECYSNWGAVFAAYSNVNASLTATPSSINPGGSSTLTWTSTNASLCLATGDWSGYKATAGSTSTGALSSNKSYTLVCGNLAGSSTPQIATVSVTPAATITSFTATPSSIAYNASATLNWSTSNATSCTASNGWSGTKATSGGAGESTGALTSNRTYGLTCTGPGGTSALSNVTVTVASAPPAITSFFANSPSEWFYLTWTSTNSTSCTRTSSPAWGWWNGTGATSGGAALGNYRGVLGYGVHNFYLTCTGPGGTTPVSTVSIDNGAEPPPFKCFIAGTKVLLANGTVKTIEEINIGDVLLGENDSRNEVLGFLHHPKSKSPIYGFNGDKPFATEDHPFMTTEGWKSINPDMTKMSSPNLEVNKLEVGDTLVTETGLVKIDSINIGELEEGGMVYNFILGGNHTYYANGYLVSDYYGR